MLRTFLFAIVFLSFCKTQAQDSIRFSHTWEKGQQTSFTLSRADAEYAGDTLCETSHLVYRISFLVTAYTPSGNIVEATYIRIHKEQKVLKPTADKFVVAKAIKLLKSRLYDFKTLKVNYLIDDEGSFAGISNEADIKEYINCVFNAIGQDSNVSTHIKNAIEQFRPQFLSPDYYNYAFLPELMFYHQIYDSKWKIGSGSIEVEMANPFTGQPVPGTMTTEVSKIDEPGKGTDAYNLSMLQIIDSKSLKSSIQNKIKDVYEKIEKPENGSPDIRFGILTEYVMRGNMVRKMDFTKQVSSPDGTKAIQKINLK
jgi:hypothetical protein